MSLINAFPGGSSDVSELSELEDVTLSSAANGDILKFNGNKWVNDKKFNYSTEEQVVGTWIDGKPLYQKSISMSSWTVGHGISNLGDVISCIGVINSGNMRFLIPYVSDNVSGYRMTFVVDDTNIDIQHGSGWTFSTVVATIQYTKTTD